LGVGPPGVTGLSGAITCPFDGGRNERTLGVSTLDDELDETVECCRAMNSACTYVSWGKTAKITVSLKNFEEKKEYLENTRNIFSFGMNEF
jgi:hypothetical protein